MNIKFFDNYFKSIFLAFWFIVWYKWVIISTYKIDLITTTIFIVYCLTYIVLFYFSYNKLKIKNIIVFDDLEKAFKYATSLKIDKKVILFSPATSSFDQYQNYQERGYHFEQLIQRYRSQDDEE